jgi:hypothetical protein
MKRRQSRVARRGAIATLLFEVIEKRQDRIAAEIVNREFHN